MRYAVLMDDLTIGHAEMSERVAYGRTTLVGPLEPTSEYDLVRDVCTAPARLHMARGRKSAASG